MFRIRVKRRTSTTSFIKKNTKNNPIYENSDSGSDESSSDESPETTPIKKVIKKKVIKKKVIKSVKFKDSEVREIEHKSINEGKKVVVSLSKHPKIPPKEYVRIFTDALPLTPYFYSNKNYNKVRRSKLIMFSDALEKFEKFKSRGFNLKMEILKRIERGCYNTARRKGEENGSLISWSDIRFLSLYHDICYKVVINLNPTTSVGSDYLATLLLENTKKPSELAKMTTKEMCPEKYTLIDKKITLTNEGVKRKTTKLYYCPKCKRNEAVPEELQDRSGDENSSLILECVPCGNRWRIAG